MATIFGPANPNVRCVRVRMADVDPQPLRWLWPGRIPRGKLTMLAGDPGLGKSMITADIAARVSAGLPWPNMHKASADVPGDVIILSAEDDLADTIRPRLDAAGAESLRVDALTALDLGKHGRRGLRLDKDLPWIEQSILGRERPRLLIIDPITAYLGATDSHRNSDVRGLLASLAQLAEHYRLAVVCVTHLNKTEGSRAIYRMTGSLAFSAAARAAWLVMADRDDHERRLMLPVKMNLQREPTGLAYRINNNHVEWESEEVTTRVDDLLSAPGMYGNDQSGRPGAGAGVPGQCDDAKAWLKDALSSGPRAAKELLEQADAEGIAVRTLRRAKDAMRVKARNSGQCWEWCLPGQHAQADEPSLFSGNGAEAP